MIVLGQLLADRGHHYEIVAIGGGSLLLLKLIERTTKDLDLVALLKDGQLISADPLPPALLQAAEDVGKALELGKDWLNTGPSSLLKGGMPKGFLNRVHTHQYKGLTVHLADRFDQICFKLYASVDQGPQSKHFELPFNRSKTGVANMGRACGSSEGATSCYFLSNHAVSRIFHHFRSTLLRSKRDDLNSYGQSNNI